MTNHNHNHNEEITLRCNRCGKPITPAEAILTPTGYRCAECVKLQQKTFDTSKPLDYILGFIVAAVLGLLGSWLTTRIGFFTILLAPAAGVAIAEVVRFLIKKRRSKRLFNIVSIGIVVGALPLLATQLINLVLRLSAGAFSLFSLLPLGYQVLFLVMAVPSAYYRLSGSRRR